MKILNPFYTALILLCVITPQFAMASPINPMITSFPEPSMAKFKQNFPKTFKVWSPSVIHHQLSLKYGRSLRGKNISPAILWRGLPKGTTHLFMAIVDGVCTWGCNSQGKAIHWVVNFPLSLLKTKGPFLSNGFKENAAKSKQVLAFTKANAMGKDHYLGPCSPIGQPHAWVIQLTAYKLNHGKPVILGKTQSIPFLFPKSEL